MVDWKGVLYYEPLLENQMINSNKYCSQLDQLKAALDKHLELVNRRCIIFHQNTARPHFSFTRQKLLQFGEKQTNKQKKQPKNCYNLTGKFWFILCIHQTLHLQISIYLNIYKILLMEKYFSSLEDYKKHR